MAADQPGPLLRTDGKPTALFTPAHALRHDKTLAAKSSKQSIGSLLQLTIQLLCEDAVLVKASGPTKRMLVPRLLPF